ncbi:MAG: FAD-dependent tricarballylate dehydrogenase TcuA [Steroidobacteraceae bacterium]|nr:FAD-dependent tricarballylate dehydrogenase TcuA [Steroidobacteraceae bacterium]
MPLSPPLAALDPLRIYDVLILGGGNAGLCAAIAARQAGASVLVLEQAPRSLRGGNSRHARNFRVMHDAPSEYLHAVYRRNEYWNDLAQVRGGNVDEGIARVLITESARVIPWMTDCGARFERPQSGVLTASRKTAFLLGGGKALLNAYYRTAQRLGIGILYGTEALSLRIKDHVAREITVSTHGHAQTVRAKTVVVASGSFQANVGWLKRYWGEAADHFSIRGTVYANGRVLANLLDQGAASIGNPATCHMVAVDGRAPKYDGGIVTRVGCMPFGIVVDRNGRRFYDEGANIGPSRYSLWGQLVARSPGQVAYAVSDAKAAGLFRPSIYPPIQARTIAELARRFAVDADTLVETVRTFNQAAGPVLAGGAAPSACRTEGITPPKTRWALRIDTPPFTGYPLRPGVTFSYLGVKVDERARVLMTDGRPAANVFASGSIMAANVIGQGYLAGIGMTIGTVFGRIAGREAARYAGY